MLRNAWYSLPCSSCTDDGLGVLSTTHSISTHLAYLYLEPRPPILIPSSPALLPIHRLPSSAPMTSSVHHPHHLLDSSWRILDQVRSLSVLLLHACADPSQTTSPSLREILAAFKFSKGQDGDCQLLMAVLNAKSAEDQVLPPVALNSTKLTTRSIVQRTAAIANLHARLLESQPDKYLPTPSPPPTYSIPRLHIPSPSSSPRSYSPYSPSTQHSEISTPVSSHEPSRSHRQGPHSSKKHRRSPYERPVRLSDEDIRSRSSRYNYGSHRSPCSSNGSDASSPRSREAMSIGTLLTAQTAFLDDDERGVSSERSTSRKLST